MAKNGPIIIIDEDAEDRQVVTDLLKELGVANQVKGFSNCNEVLLYLMSTTDRPFLIFSEINIPGMSGLELRQKMMEIYHLKNKSIPFIFLANTARQEVIDEAYQTMVQGYFEKPQTLDDLKATLQMIIHYWRVSRHPYTD